MAWEDEIPLDDRLGSPAQQEWQAVADLLRGHITRLAQQELGPQDLAQLASAAVNAITINHAAESYDVVTGRITDRFGCGH